MVESKHAFDNESPQVLKAASLQAKEVWQGGYRHAGICAQAFKQGKSMRFADLIAENTTVLDAVLDLLAILAGDGINSISLDVLADELAKLDIDEPHYSTQNPTIVLVSPKYSLLE